MTCQTWKFFCRKIANNLRKGRGLELTFLRNGLSAKLKAIIGRIFLKETAEPDLLKDFSYAERCKYANLMIKILADKPVSANEPWYPESTV